MTSRGVLGLLTALLMFHLTLVGSDVVCAEHGTAGAHQAAAHGGDHEHEAMTAASANTNDVADHKPCEVPTRPQCCEAFASCSVSLVATATPQRIVTGDFARGILAAAAHRLASQAVAPEPPPPRA
jgi:hypothetical protein